LAQGIERTLERQFFNKWGWNLDFVWYPLHQLAITLVGVSPSTPNGGHSFQISKSRSLLLHVTGILVCSSSYALAKLGIDLPPSKKF
jgi:hypothetical protein